jgi:lipoprotein-anchoring transpeptidase ErfK/SrfK
VLLLAGSGSVAQARLSENSNQVAYQAGLGIRASHDAAAATGPVAARTARCAASMSSVGSTRVAFAALVRRNAVIRKAPEGRASVIARFGRFNVDGFRQVFAVIGKHSGSGCSTDWYRVELPILPNGTTGWVRAWAVETYPVRSRIAVDLSQRRLRVFRAGKLVLATAVAVGSSATPTPLGRYFVNERYVLPDARGPFGPNALGISAHSNVLQHVWVDEGPIGIHGTNEPWSIGRAASHGCIRVANDVMRRLFRLAPAGTPVIVET